MEKENTVYVLQELPGTKIGRPKYNIIGAQKCGTMAAVKNLNKHPLLP